MSAAVALTAPAAELTVIPVDHESWPDDPGFVPTVYIRVTFDLATGRLAIEADPRYRGPARDARELQRYPGSYVHHWDFPVPVPSHMTWEISMLHPTAEQAEKLLDLIAAQARVILSELVPVEGRAAGGFDWSLRAAAAVQVIDAFTLNWWHALSPDSVVNADSMIEHAYTFRGLLDMSDALAAAPELESPDWAVMPDAELDQAAAHLARFTPFPSRDQLLAAAHLDPTNRYATNTPIYLVGVLATLYRLRAERAGALAPVDATAWFAGRPTRLTVVNDGTPDAELAKLAAAEERIAAAAGKRLLGALAYLTAVRSAHRDRVRQDLAVVAERTAGIEEQVAQLRSTRAALLLRIDAWKDPKDGDESHRYARLARMAGISRQSVRSLLTAADQVNMADGREG